MNKVLTAIVMTGLLFFAGITQAQDKSDRKARKELKKQQARAEYEQNLSQFREWVDSRSFVILTDNITGRNGTIYNLQPTVNFIEVEGNSIMIQTSHPARIGLNGLGGVTTQGRINTIEVYENEAGEPISMMITFATPILGTANMSVHVNGDGNTTAYLRGNWGGMVTFRGDFNQPDSTYTFEGMRHM